MPKSSKILAIVFVLAFALLATWQAPPEAQALNKDDLIRKAFQEVLDFYAGDKMVAEYYDKYTDYESFKRYLNTEFKLQREEAVRMIYAMALKRYPRTDELNFHLATLSTTNAIRKQLFESVERQLAIDDAYLNALGRLPRDDEREFLNNSRVDISKQFSFLTYSDERKAMINDLAKEYSRRDAYEYEIILFNETSVSEKRVKLSPYFSEMLKGSHVNEIREYYKQERMKQENVYYVDDDNWGKTEDGTPDNPYHRIYRALEEVPQWSTVIVRAGEYREGPRGVPVGVDVVGESAEQTKLYMSLEAYSRSTISNIHFKGETVRLSQGKTPIVKNCIVSFSDWNGIEYYGSGNPVVINNTIVGNNNAGLSLHEHARAIIYNNIFAVNRVDFSQYPSSYLSRCHYNLAWGNIEQNLCNNHAIYEDPQFVDNEDLHVRIGSPAVDAGSPDFDYRNEPEPNGSRINLGAYGNTATATVSSN